MAELNGEETAFSIEDWKREREAHANETWSLDEGVQAELKVLADQFLQKCNEHGVPMSLVWLTDISTGMMSCRNMCNLMPIHRAPFEFLVADLITRQGYGEFLRAQDMLEEYGTSKMPNEVSIEDLPTILKNLLGER